MARHIALPRQNKRIVAGGLTLEAIEPVRPVRFFTRASCGAVFYAGRLTLTVHYDFRCFGPEEGRELLDRYVAEIRAALAACATRRQRLTPPESPRGRAGERVGFAGGN